MENENAEIKKKDSSRENKIRDGVKKERDAAEKFASRITWRGSILLLVIVIILNAVCNIIVSLIPRVIISIILAVAGGYGLLPIKKEALTRRLINWHLKMFGKITNEFESESEDSFA